MIAKSLRKGDKIGFIKPSDKIDDVRLKLIKKAIQNLEEKGFNVLISDHMTKTDKYGVSGGSAKERADELNSMFKDNSVQAIWCAHGGDTVIELLEYIDFDNIKNNPKVFMGMSDIDVLHLAINKKVGLTTFNSCDPKIGRGFDFDREYSQKWFTERMINGSKQIESNSEWKTVREGVAEGKVLGCNLTSLVKIAGTEYFPDFADSILFLEGYSTDIKKAIYKLTQIKLLGVFDKIKGIVVGHVLGFEVNPQHDKDGNRVNFEDIVLDITKDYDFPILKINEFGHRCDNFFVPIGAKMKMDATNKTLDISEEILKKE